MMNWKRILTTTAYRVAGRELNSKITSPIPMLLVNEDDAYAGVVAGLDSSIRLDNSASRALMSGFVVALASFTADKVHQTLNIPDKYIL
jgi:hypothetical protein